MEVRGDALDKDLDRHTILGARGPALRVRQPFSAAPGGCFGLEGPHHLLLARRVPLHT
jgi:hypothetical protein